MLFVTGFVGGIFTSFAGSGLDICSFSVLTLLFRVSEKVATPTSVVLMGGASAFGFYWRDVMMEESPIDILAWEYIAVCIPIVVIGAPCGAILGSHFHRQVLAALIYILDTLALVAAFVLIPQNALLAGVSVAIIAAGFIIFNLITYAGQKLLERIPREEKKNLQRRNSVPDFEDEEKKREFKKAIRPALRIRTVAVITDTDTDEAEKNENNVKPLSNGLGFDEATLERLRNMAGTSYRPNSVDIMEEEPDQVMEEREDNGSEQDSFTHVEISCQSDSSSSGSGEREQSAYNEDEDESKDNTIDDVKVIGTGVCNTDISSDNLLPGLANGHVCNGTHISGTANGHVNLAYDDQDEKTSRV